MSRLFIAHTGWQQIAEQFGVADATTFPVPTEMTEGTIGPVVLENKGRRMLRQARWGFPRATREAFVRGEEPGIIGLVADLTNPMWDQMVVDQRYRCLIPLTHFANPAGDAGSKTRSWFSITGKPLVAWAGFCRNIPDVGPVFADMTMAANDTVMPYNDRMPVLIAEVEYERWLHGSIEDVIQMQYRPPIPADRIAVMHTEDRWRSGKVPDFTGMSEMALV